MAVVEEKRGEADQMMYSLVALSKAKGSIAFIRRGAPKDLDAVQPQTDSIYRSSCSGSVSSGSPNPLGEIKKKSGHCRNT
jgi:hypothetical protein